MHAVSLLLLAMACLPDSLSWVPDKPIDCQDYQELGFTATGIYTIYPLGSSPRGFQVRCDMDTESGGWTVFQRRVSDSDFYKDWYEYQVGFGNLSENFWLGNQQISLISSQGWYELRVDLKKPDNETGYAKYNVFQLEGWQTQYRLKVSGYNGTAGDSLSYHSDRPFSTKDRDNDVYAKPCAVEFKGAWWYGSCHHSNLNGLYGSTEYAKGPSWNTFGGRYVPMIETEMKMRRWTS